MVLIGCFFVIGVPSTSALFFFRVKAVYYWNKFITMFFGALLFALFGLSVLMPFTASGEHIGTTQICITTKIEHFGALPLFLNSLMDTLVFIAISLRIISYSLVGGTFNARMRSFFQGAGLPSLSKSILQGGQLYYLFVTRDFSLPGYRTCWRNDLQGNIWFECGSDCNDRCATEYDLARFICCSPHCAWERYGLSSLQVSPTGFYHGDWCWHCPIFYTKASISCCCRGLTDGICR
jgi:hypothetical protein